MLKDLIYGDLKKQKNTLLLIVVIVIPLAVSALLWVDLYIRYDNYLKYVAIERGMTSWQILLKEQRILCFKDMLPFIATIILAEVFNCEYKNNGWTLLLTQPIKRRNIIISKYMVSLIFITIMLLINFVSLIVVGKLIGFSQEIEWTRFINMFLVQLLSLAALTTIHLFILLKSKNYLKTISISMVMCVVSQHMFYDDLPISKFNPYSFPSYSDILERGNVAAIIGISIALFVVGVVLSIKCFDKKECF